MNLKQTRDSAATTFNVNNMLLLHKSSQNVVFMQQLRFISFTKLRQKNRKKDHWHVVASKKTATKKALEHFDDFYKTLFRYKWPSVRLGLLTPQKYVALVNNFGDVDKTTKMLENMGAMHLKQIFDACESNLKNVKAEQNREEELENVFKLDRLMEDKAKSEGEKEINILYPEGKGEKLKSLFVEEVENAEEEVDENYESNRIIDPELGLDSGALHEFIPATKLKGMDHFVSESQYYSYYKGSGDVQVNTEKQYKLNFPKHLNVYSFYRGVFDQYPQPKRTSTGTFNYFLMDGASVLPILALDVQPGDQVLDMCSAPGGKALAILQTLHPKLLVCNDLSQSRVNRIHSVFEQFLYDYENNWKGMVTVQKSDGLLINDTGIYDKILVDVPCTNDRVSLFEDDNNIFRQDRIKERLRIPETQADLLCNALHLVKPGGTVVYSTCSLSPIQNDGVVGMALRRLWEERRQEFTVINLYPALKPTGDLFNYGHNIGLKYGSLIVPFLPSNFGPMYFSKIIKKI